MQLIQTAADLAALIERLRREPLIAVDTEAASFHRYLDRIYLLQLSSREETAVVDPLAAGTLAPLGELLADPAVEIVFHDADYDLRLLDREYGLHAETLFDTRVAAQLLNEPGSAWPRCWRSIRVSGWTSGSSAPTGRPGRSRRDAGLRGIRYPVPAGAAGHPGRQLETRGRMGWAQEEFALLTGIRAADPEGAEPGWLRMKGAKALRGRELAVLREVWEWREGVARRADRATFRILNNEPMLAIAKAAPSDLAALKTIPGIGGDQAERRGREILAAVRRGLELPEDQLPRIVRPPRRQPDLAFEARVERLKVRRNALALELDLAPGVLCPNGTLEAIARANPASVEQLQAVPELRRWQARVIGPSLFEALQEAQPAAG